MFSKSFLRPVIVVALFTMAIIMPLSSVRLTVNPFLKSVLVPGWGQLTQGNASGYAMLTAEAMFWSAKFYTDSEQTLRDRDSYEYALKYAHINPGKYSDQYYRDLTIYASSGYDAGGYNAMVRSKALEDYPYDPQLQQQYINENIYPNDLAWQWDSVQNKKKFSTKRKEILELQDQTKIITGLLIANHLVSGIDMLRQRKRWHNATPSFGYYKDTPTLNLMLNF